MYLNIEKNQCPMNNSCCCFQVPDTMEYVVIKAELYDAKKKLKIMERRNEILDVSKNYQ